jgi:hypothetical protein
MTQAKPMDKTCFHFRISSGARQEWSTPGWLVRRLPKLSLTLRTLFALTAIVALAIPVEAQVLYGTLTGSVSDPSGAAIP